MDVTDEVKEDFQLNRPFTPIPLTWLVKLIFQKLKTIYERYRGLEG